MKVRYNITLKEDAPEYARVLKNLREQLKVNQKDLAHSLGISGMALSYWERGERRPRLDEIEAWARALGYEIVISIEPLPTPPKE